MKEWLVQDEKGLMKGSLRRINRHAAPAKVLKTSCVEGEEGLHSRGGRMRVESVIGAEVPGSRNEAEDYRVR